MTRPPPLPLPLLALTMGDPAGTGPELITRALAQPEVRALCRPLVVGDAAVLAQALRFTGERLRIVPCASVAEADFSPGVLAVLDQGLVDLSRLELGKVSAMAGHAATLYVKKAAALALAGEVDAIVTCALNKEAMNLAGHLYDGHTGLLAELCAAPKATMMLAAGKLRVSHVSTHVPLRVAVERVRTPRILEVLELTHAAIQRLGVARPRLAVAGLNPHAGENGLFGDEEQRHITPAIEEARARGLDVTGPYPGDTIFFRAAQGEFDGTVAMFHDQGHVAAKMLGIWLGVNVTLGLPIIRTSVEHGTNFDLAGTGRSDPRSLLEAIKLAAIMAGHPSPKA
jgi:4-phospho-D-threonate 3-dehydrogenase / 4-phospho-D-erythronate 3-dehydrogenase